MLEKLEQIEARYEALTQELSLPEVYTDQAAYSKVAKQHRALGEIVGKYREWKSLGEELSGARELLESADDEEMRELARSEAAVLLVELRVVRRVGVDLRRRKLPGQCLVARFDLFEFV